MAGGKRLFHRESRTSIAAPCAKTSALPLLRTLRQGALIAYGNRHESRAFSSLWTYPYLCCMMVGACGERAIGRSARWPVSSPLQLQIFPDKDVPTPPAPKPAG